MDIYGFQSVTLLDYPGKVACTVFLGGCNFKCPYCHNSCLIEPSIPTCMDEEELLDILDGRKGKLDGVVFSGGEPTIHNDLPELIKKVKDRGFLVKLDTNGTNPYMLCDLIDAKLVDYVAMDIKGPYNKYHLITRTDRTQRVVVSHSVDILLNDWVDYEFRTTVVPKYHEKEDFIEIGRAIHGARRYYLQAFKQSPAVTGQFVPTPLDRLLKTYAGIMRNYVDYVGIRS